MTELRVNDGGESVYVVTSNAGRVRARTQMEHALDATNRGFRLLQKMGWKHGTGLGKHEQGIIEPVKMKENLVCLGLGKAEEYDDMTEQATRERRKLDAEIVETQEETALRLAKAARDDQIKADVTASKSAFLCTDCQKQYTTVSEMEHHLSSYDHHHRKRLHELKKQSLAPPHEQASKRKREQQHDAELLQKRMALAAAAEAAAAAKVTPPPIPVSAPQELGSVSASAARALPVAKVGFSFGAKATAASSKKKPLRSAIAAVFAQPLE